MRDPIPVYRKILGQFREGSLSIEELTHRYQSVFLEDSGQYDDALWRIFNDAFMAAEFYTDNARLPSSDPDLYLDERKFRKAIDDAVMQLDSWLKRVG
ncbi:MAG: hypothetical protein AB7O88_10880 [Reyranellaceae bacterium]